jgi:fatty acid desaturase
MATVPDKDCYMSEIMQERCVDDMAFSQPEYGNDATPSWVRDARAAIRTGDRDFFAVSPLRYWLDFLLSIVCAYTAATVYLMAPLGSWWQLAAFPMAVFWLYRLGSLIHEVCHLGHHEMRAFKVTWNLLVGVFTLTPSPFFTRHHRDHHSQKMYGTPEDPEYVANVLEGGSLKSAIGYFAIMLAYPILVFLRFLLAPLSFLHPKLRKWVLENASSLTFNHRYTRKITPFDRKAITVMELLCFLRAAAIPAAVLLGAAPISRIPLLYVLGLTTLVMNQMRQLADHHFSGDGSVSTIESHILDSCNFTGNDPLTLLFFPFSIRYHALHHLFPSLPYHNLKAAHAHLTAALPSDSPYHGLDQPGWWWVAKRTVFGGEEQPASKAVIADA